MKIKVIAAALIIILGAGVWWGLEAVQARQTQMEKSAVNTTNINTSTSSHASSSSASRLDDQGGVEVTVSWDKEGSDSSMFKFAVTMNNHMIDLSDFDYPTNTTLVINGTAVPAVVKVLNQSGAGHHVSAEIGVQSNDLGQLKAGNQFTLVIKNLASIPSRSFTWAY